MIREGRSAIGIAGWATVTNTTLRKVMGDKPWRDVNAPPVINPVLDALMSTSPKGQPWMWDLEEVREAVSGKRPRLVSRDPLMDPRPGDLLNNREIAVVMDRKLSTVKRKRENGDLPTVEVCGVPHTRRCDLEDAFRRARKPGPNGAPGRVRVAQAMKENPGATNAELAKIAELSRTYVVKYRRGIESGAPLHPETGEGAPPPHARREPESTPRRPRGGNRA